ncbi:MAG: hypothetical protein WC821_01125 [archaeon]|jgi:hypothetical protein
MLEISDKERYAMNMFLRSQKTAFLNSKSPTEFPEFSARTDIAIVYPIREIKGKIKSLFYQPLLLKTGEIEFIKVKRPRGLPYVDKSKGTIKLKGKVVGLQALTYTFTDKENNERGIFFDKQLLYKDKYYLLKLFAKEIYPHLNKLSYNDWELGAFIEMYKDIKPNEDLPRYANRTSFTRLLRRYIKTDKIL